MYNWVSMKKSNNLIFTLVLVIFAGVIGLSLKEGSYVDLKFDQGAALIRIQQHPEDPDAYLAAGVASYGLKEYVAAERYYAKALSLQETALAHNNLGNTYREMLKYTDAEASYKKAIELSPASVTSYLNLANLYKSWPDEAGDKTPEIPKLLTEALGKTERNINILYALIDYYRSVGEEAEADKLQAEINQRQA